ncbi:MAG TPA: CheR family methyltransferase [Polyangiaceae bacterium]
MAPRGDASGGLFHTVPLYRALRHEVVPLLKTWPSVKVWHAGIGDGSEVYATTIVLREEGVLERSTIWATDPDPERVVAARSGTFSATLLASAGMDYAASGGKQVLEEYATLHGDRLEMRSLLAERVAFSEHDAGKDGSFNEFQLVIYRLGASRPGFGSRQRALRLVDASLCRFGVLMLADGARLEAETMRPRYENLLRGSPVWRKLA